jgi:hypothetical protein
MSGLDMVAHTCKPSYSRGREWEDHRLRQKWSKSYGNPILTKKPGVVVLADNHSYEVGTGKRIVVQAQIQQKCKTL